MEQFFEKDSSTSAVPLGAWSDRWWDSSKGKNGLPAHQIGAALATGEVNSAANNYNNSYKSMQIKYFKYFK